MSETHEIVVLPNKPSEDEILKLISAYFDEQAKDYDEFSAVSEKRRLYLDRIDQLIVAGLRDYQKSSLNILSIGCGTGRREVKIQKQLGLKLDYLGVDASAAMCARARQNGIEAIPAPWLHVDLQAREFDAVFYLHSFGLCPSRQRRLQELKKIYSHLAQNGLFFLDVLNLDDVNEWGPEIQKHAWEHDLSRLGFEAGDVMYRQIGKQAVSYFHYFTRAEILDLLTLAGFAQNKIQVTYVGYDKNSGQIVGAAEGAMLLVYRK